MKTFSCRAPHCSYSTDNSWDVCAVCWDWRIQLLDDLPWLYRRVDTALVPSGSSALRERVSTTAPGSSIPLRTGPLHALALAKIIVDAWTDTFRRMGFRLEKTEPDKASDGHVFARCVLFCKMFDGKLTGGPLAGDYYLDMYRAYWTLARVDNSRADAVRLALACPCCERKTLIERHAGEYVQCLTCGRPWSQAALAKESRG